MRRAYSHCDVPAIVAAGKAEAKRQAGALSLLLGDLAGHLERQHAARVTDAAEMTKLRQRIVDLGGGFDARGLHGDPKEPPPAPQEVRQGSWVDQGSHA